MRDGSIRRAIRFIPRQMFSPLLARRGEKRCRATKNSRAGIVAGTGQDFGADLSLLPQRPREEIANPRHSHTLFVRPGRKARTKSGLTETRTAITVAVPENGGPLSHDCYLHVLFIDCLVVSRRPGNVRRRSESTAGGNCRSSERRGATEERALAGWRARVSEELNFRKGLNLDSRPKAQPDKRIPPPWTFRERNNSYPRARARAYSIPIAACCRVAI